MAEDQWKAEALALREGLACVAEALGWNDVRQDNGDLHLPSGQDIATVITERLMEVNVNDQVWVKLTAAGKETYESEPARQMVAEQMPQYAQPVQDVMRFELWDLMHIFGPAMRNGGPALFVKQRIYFKDPRPKLAVVPDGDGS